MFGEVWFPVIMTGVAVASVVKWHTDKLEKRLDKIEAWCLSIEKRLSRRSD